MAVNFPSGIYSEGQGIFNAMPYARMIEARKKAKEESFTKYYDKLTSQINPAGVRAVDIIDPITGQGIEKDIQNMKTYAIENRDALIKDGSARMKLEQMVRNIKFRIDQSKNIAGFQTELGKAMVGNKVYASDNDMEIQERMGYSIYNPKHYKEDYVNEAQGLPAYTDNLGTSFGWQDFSGAVNTLKQDEISKFYKSALGDAQKIIDPKATQRVGLSEIFTLKYTDDAIKSGADVVRQKIQLKPVDLQSRRENKTYDLKMDDPDWMAKADPLFQKYYGKPIENIKDAAAADFLLMATQAVETKTYKIPTGGGRSSSRVRGGKTPPTVWNAWGDLDTRVTDAVSTNDPTVVSEIAGKKYIPVSLLGSDLSDLIGKMQSTSSVKGLPIYPVADLYVSKEPNGTIGLYYKLGKKPPALVSSLNQRGLNRIANPTESGRSQVEKTMKTQSAPKKIQAKGKLY